jgi:UPF0716 protein FxsA
MPLLILFYPFAELYLIYKFCQMYSFSDYLFFTITTGVVGVFIMNMIKRDIFFQIQTSLAQKQLPAEAIIHKGLMFLGGLLLFLPGFISDVLGTFLILPGFRHLFVWWVKWLLSRGIASGSARIFVSNMNWNFGSFNKPEEQTEEPRVERDAQVIDIKPIESSHKVKKDENS